jgi:nitronate monooxygenase
MTLPIREAASNWEDPNGMNLWAGTSFPKAQTGPVADIVASLTATD